MSERIFNYEPLWGSWEVDKLIGEGRYGKVYRIVKAQNSYLSKEIEAAAKIITIPTSEQHVQANQLGVMNKEEYFEAELGRLITEIENMNTLKGNSNIVSFEDYEVKKYPDEAKWDILIRMEYLTPLNSYRKDNKLQTNDILRLGIDVCKALETCQKQSIIHRDIKEENIFVNDFRDFKLGDFGISKEISKTGRAASYRGTPYYMAPEVFRGKDYDHTVDIYSLGIVLYKLLNRNRFPYMPDHTQAVSIDDLDDAFDKRMNDDKGIKPPHDASETIGAIILKMIAFDNKDRYQEPGEIRQAFEAILNSVNTLDEEKEKTIKADEILINDNEAAEEENLDIYADKEYTKTVGMFDTPQKETSEAKAPEASIEEAVVEEEPAIAAAEVIAADESIDVNSKGFKTTGIFSEMPDPKEEVLEEAPEKKEKKKKTKMIIFVAAFLVFSSVIVYGINIFDNNSAPEEVAIAEEKKEKEETTEVTEETDTDSEEASEAALPAATEEVTEAAEEEVVEEKIPVEIEILEEFSVVIGDEIVLGEYFETNNPEASEIKYEIQSGGGSIEEGIYISDTVGVVEVKIIIDDTEALLKGEVGDKYVSRISSSTPDIVLVKGNSSDFNYKVRPRDTTKRNIKITTDGSGVISLASGNIVANRTGTGYVTVRDTYTGRKTTIKVRVPIEFAENNFKAAIKKQLGITTEHVFVEDVNTVSALVLRDSNIASIYGIRYFSQLETIRMDNNNIYVLGELVNLNQLKYLDLRNNNIKRVDVFKQLKGLETLRLSGNPVYAEKEKIEEITGLTIN